MGIESFDLIAKGLDNISKKATIEKINHEITNFVYVDMIEKHYVPISTGRTQEFPLNEGNAQFNKNILRWGSYNPHTDEYYVLKPRVHWTKDRRKAERAAGNKTPVGIYYKNRTGTPHWDTEYIEDNNDEVLAQVNLSTLLIGFSNKL